MRIKLGKRLQREKPEPMAVPEAPNEVWSIITRQHKQSMCERGLHGPPVGGWQIIAWRGKLLAIRVDNSPEYVDQPHLSGPL